MSNPSDADLVAEALALATPLEGQERLVEILRELRLRTTAPRGVQKFVRAWTLGRLARADGVPLEACPYVERVPGKRTFMTAYRNAWIRGWKGKDKGYAKNASLRRASLRHLLRSHRIGATG